MIRSQSAFTCIFHSFARLSGKVFAGFLLGIVLSLYSCQEAADSAEQAENQFLLVDTIPVTAVPDTVSLLLSLDTLYKYFDTLQLNGKAYFLTEGDILMPARQFQEEMMRLQTEEVPEEFQFFREKAQKVIIRYDVKTRDTIKWGRFPVRYCIDKRSFQPVANGYEIVKTAIARASSDWSNLCKVRFEYLPAFDEAPGNATGLDFIVKYRQTGGSGYVASAFYPDSPVEERLLYIYQGYWNSPDDKAGVFRHELGHILGFRHEHASRMDPVPLACRMRYGADQFPTRSLTVYDSFSVMHYFCGGAGTRTKLFSARDTVGFRMVYGF